MWRGFRTSALGERLRDVAVLFGFSTHLLPGVAQIGHPNFGAVVADGEHPCFGTDGFDVRTGRVLGYGSHLGEVDVVADVHVAGVDLEDELSTFRVGLRNLDEAVEPTGA